MLLNSKLLNLYLTQHLELYGSELNLYSNKNEINNCSHCIGNLSSKLVFVGQESIRNNDPFFMNESNKLFKKILSAISLSIDDVFTTNILKVFPYKKEFKIEEILQCKKHLEYKLSVVKPKLIVSLGHNSANYLLNNKLLLDDMRNKSFKYKNIDLMVTYSPSSLIKNSTFKKKCWDDFKKIKNFLIN